VNPAPLFTGLAPGPVVFGAAPIAGLFTPVSEEAAAGTLAAAWAAGIRAFDTAPHYGVGVSERRLGSFLAGQPRDEFTVCTKVGRLLVPAAGDVQGDEGFYGIPPLTRVRDYSRDGVRRSLEESLERLGLDRVDIVLIHDPDDFMEQAASEAYPALASLRDQGVVRAVGAGMNSASALAWLAERCDLDCVLVAGRYTLLGQSAAEVLFPLCQRRGVAVLAAGVFNSGILAGPDDGATYDYAPAPPGLLARARQMSEACARYGVPLPAAALQFTLRHPAVTAAVVGARSPEEITADVSYLSTPIPAALWAELEALLPNAPQAGLERYYLTRCGLAWKRGYLRRCGLAWKRCYLRLARHHRDSPSHPRSPARHTHVWRAHDHEGFCTHIGYKILRDHGISRVRSMVMTAV
jgi:D-threo-aldose 1-dehydrogenase